MESQTKEDRDKFKMRKRKLAVLSQCVLFHCKSKDFVIKPGCIVHLFRSRMERNDEEDRNKFKMRTLIQSNELSPKVASKTFGSRVGASSRCPRPT